VEEKEKEELFI